MDRLRPISARLPNRDGVTQRNPIPDGAWDRMANPWSGWTSLLVMPAVLYAISKRSLRLLVLVVVGALGMSVAFPVREEDADSWMTRGARSQQAWLDGDIEAGSDNWLNVASAPVWAYAFYTAYAGRLKRALAAGSVGLAMKLWFIHRLNEKLDALED